MPTLVEQRDNYHQEQAQRDQEWAARLAVVDHYLKRPNSVRTRDDLYRLAKAIGGVNIPFQPVCHDHQTPFDYLAAMCLDQTGRDVLVTASRGGGKTWTTALANAIDLNFRPGVEIASVGAIDKQAKRCYRYTKDLLAFPLTAERVVRSVMEMTEVKDPGSKSVSRYEQLIGTLNGANSPHPQKLRCDEIDLMDWEVLKELMMVPQSKNGILSSMSMISSIKFADGNMATLADHSEEMGLINLTWCYKEVSEPCAIERRGSRGKWYTVQDLEKPDRQYRVKAWENCGSCPILPSCRGDLAYSTGWILIEDTIKEFIKLDLDTWLAQKECRRPSKKAQVYPEWWDGDPHVIPDFDPPANEGVYFRAWDHTGGGDSPTVVGYWWVSPNGDFYLYDMYAASKLLVEEYASGVKRRWDRPFIRDYSDPAAAQERREYAEHGIHLTPGFNDREAGIRKVRSLEKLDAATGKPHKFVCKRCKSYREEKRLYRRAIRAGEVMDAIDPACRERDHSMDMERYGVATFLIEMEKIDRPRGQRNRPDRQRRSKQMRSVKSIASARSM
jgi:hypothetical protein